MNQKHCQINVENGLLAVSSPYLPGLVAAIKSLPYTERRWDPKRKVWLIDPKHGQQLASWIETYCDEKVELPRVSSSGNQVVSKIFEVRYMGACKLREDGTSAALGMVGGEWRIIFPEKTLRMWFEGLDGFAQRPSEEQTLYQALGIKKTASEDEIKSAYRRMAKQWHPDVCKEADAAEIFMRITDAYQLLSDPSKRARYDAGLALQASFEKQQKGVNLASKCYRAPLRCGLILMEGIEKAGWFEVSKIFAWEDITKNGKTLVVSWPLGAKEPIETWV